MTYSDYCNNILIFLYDSMVEKKQKLNYTVFLSTSNITTRVNSILVLLIPTPTTNGA